MRILYLLIEACYKTKPTSPSACACGCGDVPHCQRSWPTISCNLQLLRARPFSRNCSSTAATNGYEACLIPQLNQPLISPLHIWYVALLLNSFPFLCE
uniref:Uncharacterized protein n=1 Tax=Arundo donax TaxID=35708 RepID=A0A0A8YIF8_ARUDO